MQLPLWSPESNWKPPELSDLPSWAGAKRVAIDIETKDPFLKQLGPSVRRGGYIAGISFAIEDMPKGYYLPIRHAGGGNMDLQPTLNYLRENCKNFTGTVVGANFNYDLDYLLEEGIEFPNIEYIRDIQIADPLINELHRSYSFENIAKRYGVPGKDETMLREAAAAHGVSPKGGMHLLHSKFVGAYGEQDAFGLLPILRKQEKIIDEQDLWDIYNLESEVLPVLVKMRRRGVLIDQDRLDGVDMWSLEQESECLAKVKHITGIEIRVGDVWKAEALAPALEYIGIKIERTAKTNKPSIRADILDEIDHPVADALLWARKVNKLRTTFSTSVRRYMVNGRIHCTLNQLPVDKGDDSGGVKGARYGRLSCQDPNLQQQPSRDEFAKMWRGIYRPEAGMQWASCDYSQQEPRMLIHYAELCKLPKAAQAADQYRSDPETDNHQLMAEMAGIERKPAKELFLGKCYGMGGAKLCTKLGLPTRWGVFFYGQKKQAQYFENPEAAWELARNEGGKAFEVAGVEGQQIIDKFDKELPFVGKLAKDCQDRARKKGVIVTVGNRHCHFPIDNNGQYDWTHKALNRLIQGSSADQTKRALVEVDKAGHYLQLQVHDELCLSVKDPDEAEAVAEIMRTCVPLNVPSKVDVEIGASWGESM